MPIFLVNTWSSSEDYDAECNTVLVDIDVTYARWLLALKTEFEQIVARQPATTELSVADYNPIVFDKYAVEGLDPELLEFPADGRLYARVDGPMSVIPEEAHASLDYLNVLIGGRIPLKSAFDGVQWECGPHDTDITVTSDIIPWIEIEQIAKEDR